MNLGVTVEFLEEVVDTINELADDSEEAGHPRRSSRGRKTAERLRAAIRLEYLRGELRAERISTGELVELESLKEFIEPGDVELLEAAGVPEFPE